MPHWLAEFNRRVNISLKGHATIREAGHGAYTLARFCMMVYREA